MFLANSFVGKQVKFVSRRWPYFGQYWLLWMALAAGFALGVGPLSAQVNVTTFHNDIGRTGQNVNETVLTKSNVNTAQFGKLFAQPVDGQVYAQPLYLSGITVNGGTHNVVFVATQNDSVYAFDADTNGGANASPLWKDALLSTAFGAEPGATTVSSNLVGSDINPQVGITGTPVIDPTSGTLYVVSKTYENGAAVERLHALSVTTGAEKFGGPRVLTATVAGTGNGSVNGTLTFDPLWENQRPGLLLLNGIVWIGFSAHGDNGPWHGWILGYNASNLQQTGVYCASPNGTGSGFWMSGQGLAADQIDPINKPFGRMFVPTGNGDYNAAKPYTNAMDFGDSDLNLDLTNGVPTITDEFTTNQQANLDAEDGDIASGGLMVLPAQGGPFPNLGVQVGKQGTLYLLNRENLGGYNLAADQVVQELPYAVGHDGVWASPAYWNGTVYYWGRVDYLKAFALVNGVLSTAPTESLELYNYPGATPSISANGNAQGLVWSINTENVQTGPAVLQAHDASNVSSLLYSSDKVPARDSAGYAVKFAVPTIANGKVYVGTATEVDIYGLLSGTPSTAVPSITPGSESFAGTVQVAITDSSANASIYYTTNGSAANTGSTLYTGPILVSTTETINAVASASAALVSAQASATFTALNQTQPVVFSVPAGIYATAQSVVLSDTTANATIYYTLDGTAPSVGSNVYAWPIAVGSTETIHAFATAAGLSASTVTAATYTIQTGQTGISFPAGFADSTGVMILNGSAGLNDTRLQLTDGLPAEGGSAFFHKPVNVQAFNTTFTFQLSNPNADGITFTIQNDSVNALGGNGYALGYSPMKNSIAVKFDLYNTSGEGPDSTGLYLNGAVPSVPAIDLSPTGINLHSDDTMSVNLVYDGTALTMSITDIVTDAVWTTSWLVDIPGTIGSTTAYAGFTGATGGETASQKILTWAFTSGASAYAAPVGNLDQAVDLTTKSTTVSTADTIFISGWVADPLDGSPLKNVTVLIDGVGVGTPTLNVPRPDVAAYYSKPAWANSGYNYSYNANLLSSGTHVITVTGVNSHMVATTLKPVTITVYRPNPVGNLESAVDSVTGKPSVSQSEGLLYVGGWAADATDKGTAKVVQVFVDGVAIGLATVGQPRPDVAAAEHNPAWLDTGFYLAVKATGLSVGTHAVTAVATDSANLSTNLGPLTLTVTP